MEPHIPCGTTARKPGRPGPCCRQKQPPAAWARLRFSESKVLSVLTAEPDTAVNGHVLNFTATTYWTGLRSSNVDTIYKSPFLKQVITPTIDFTVGLVKDQTVDEAWLALYDPRDNFPHSPVRDSRPTNLFLIVFSYDCIHGDTGIANAPTSAISVVVRSGILLVVLAQCEFSDSFCHKYSSRDGCFQQIYSQVYNEDLRCPKQKTVMIKIAIVGTNGLAQYIANSLATQSSHQFVILSRRPNPGLTAKGWQVLTVDYSNSADLRFKLAGVDTVISTISGTPQLALIDASAAAHVRRFVPSEFGGPPSLRPQNDLLDRSHRAAILRLHQLEPTGMRFTIFTCGILYERFAPGGMAASQIGLHSDIGQEGDYLMDFRRRRAQIPHMSSAGHPVTVCMTSAHDVARFVIAALGLPTWPREFRLRGDRMSVRDIIAIAETIQGRSFETSAYTRSSLQDALTYARAVSDRRREIQNHHLIATAEGRFDFANANLNHLIAIQPERFRDYLVRVWSAAGSRDRRQAPGQ